MSSRLKARPREKAMPKQRLRRSLFCGWPLNQPHIGSGARLVRPAGTPHRSSDRYSSPTWLKWSFCAGLVAAIASAAVMHCDVMVSVMDRSRRVVHRRCGSDRRWRRIHRRRRVIGVDARKSVPVAPSAAPASAPAPAVMPTTVPASTPAPAVMPTTVPASTPAPTVMPATVPTVMGHRGEGRRYERRRQQNSPNKAHAPTSNRS
jgi:hypothetical protein